MVEMTRPSRIANCPSGPSTSTGDKRSAILTTTMSFACGMYAMNGADVVLGVDRLWVKWNEEERQYVHLQDGGTKSARLNDRVGIAFTGDSICIADAIAKLYGDGSLAKTGVNVLEEAMSRTPTLNFDLDAVISKLNEIVPAVKARFTDVCSSAMPISVILCGLGKKKPEIFYCSIESEWQCKPHLVKAGKAFSTLPPEACYYQHLEPAVNDILNGRGSSTKKIRTAIGYLAAEDVVHTVGETCALRRLSKKFEEEEYEAILPA